MYLILTRALRNVGDFLIYSRGVSLIRQYKPNKEIIEGKAWIPLKDQFELEFIKKIDAIIIPGGPGVRYNLYPEIYPLLPEIFFLKIPVIFLGIGSKFYPGTDRFMKKIKLSGESKKLLHHIESLGYFVGVRDELSKKILLNNGIKKVSLNGCPAWYDLDYIGKSMKKPEKINKILFTTPATLIHYKQAQKIIEKLRQSFPTSEILVTFHSGIKNGSKDKFGKTQSKLNVELEKCAKKFQCETVDASSDIDVLESYNSIDLHIGYRVHAHIYFLSHRKPTFLISEDSRGSGVLETLGGVGFPAWSNFALICSSNKLLLFMWKIFQRLFGPNSWLSQLKVNKKISNKCISAINDELSSNFSSYDNIPNKIDSNLKKKMMIFINNLP